MILFTTILKRVTRNKANLFSMLVVPIFFISMVVVLGGRSSSQPIRIGVTDLDQTPLTQLMIQKVQERAAVTWISQDEGIEALTQSKIDYRLIIPADFTQDLIENQNPVLEGYGIVEDDQTIPTQLYLSNYLDGLKTIGAAAGNETEFYQGLQLYQEGPYQIKVTAVDETVRAVGMTQGGMGFLIMSMLFFSSMITNEILRDKERRTMFRILSAPLSLKQYMLEHLMSFLFLSQIQIISVLAIMRFIFKMNLGSSPLSLYLILLLFSVVCIAFGVAITSLSKDTHQASVLGSTMITPMAMLGGCFWSREIMPEIMQKISYFVPVTWVLRATEKILYGEVLLDVGYEVILLILFSVIFFLLGTWHKSDITP